MSELPSALLSIHPSTPLSPTFSPPPTHIRLTHTHAITPSCSRPPTITTPILAITISTHPSSRPDRSICHLPTYHPRDKRGATQPANPYIHTPKVSSLFSILTYHCLLLLPPIHLIIYPRAPFFFLHETTLVCYYLWVPPHPSTWSITALSISCRVERRGHTRKEAGNGKERHHHVGPGSGFVHDQGAARNLPL